MKDEKVCQGCKYKMPSGYCYPGLTSVCDYVEMTGKSRLVIEMAKGGYRTDSCPCYEAGNRGKGRKVIPKV